MNRDSTTFLYLSQENSSAFCSSSTTRNYDCIALAGWGVQTPLNAIHRFFSAGKSKTNLSSKVGVFFFENKSGMESLFRKMRKKIHNFIISVKKYKKKIKTIVCNIGS